MKRIWLVMLLLICQAVWAESPPDRRQAAVSQSATVEERIMAEAYTRIVRIHVQVVIDGAGAAPDSAITVCVDRVNDTGALTTCWISDGRTLKHIFWLSETTGVYELYADNLSRFLEFVVWELPEEWAIAIVPPEETSEPSRPMAVRFGFGSAIPNYPDTPVITLRLRSLVTPSATPTATRTASPTIEPTATMTRPPRVDPTPTYLYPTVTPFPTRVPDAGAPYALLSWHDGHILTGTLTIDDWWRVRTLNTVHDAINRRDMGTWENILACPTNVLEMGAHITRLVQVTDNYNTPYYVARGYVAAVVVMEATQ